MLWNDWLNSWRRPLVRHRCGIGLDRERCQSIERLEQRCLLSAAAINGTVFNDINENRQLDAGEAGLSGWTVFVDDNGNAQLDLRQVQGVSNARIEIPDLGRGVSSLEVSGAPGTIADVVVRINLSHTFSADLHAFLVSPTGTRIELFQGVGGSSGAGFRNTVFQDDALLSINSPQASSPFSGSFRPNQSLSRLTGESPNGTWSLEVIDEAGEDMGTINQFQLTIRTIGPGSELFAVTDESGAYLIEGIAPGTRTIREVPRQGFRPTTPAAISQTITLVSDEIATGVNFGNVPLPGTIHGQVRNDLNGNGIDDPNEPGSNGWVIQLLNANTRAVVQETISSSIDLNRDGRINPRTESGLYSFANLPQGRYLVREVLRDGWKETAPQADNSVVDDDPVVQSGRFEVTAPPTGTANAPAPWLPDLIVDMQNSAGLRNAFLDGDILRFGQASPNVGDGPMRLVGGDINGDGTQQVAQRIFDDQGGFTDRLAGNFSFHPEHNHIHFNDFAMYSLRTVLPDNNSDGIPEVGGVVRGGAKTSFCLIDVERFSTDPPLPNADPDRSGFGCDTQQQISVGWSDIYSPDTEGQEINVAGLEPGDYWLEATVDPDNHFVEKDETNNTGRVLIHLGSAQPVHRVTIDPGADLRGLDFGNFQRITVSGSVFRDANSNARRDASENQLDRIAVFIDTNGDHILNNPTSGDGVADGLAQEPWALTDANGNFRFTGLSGGQYQVRVVAPNRLIQTTETPARVSAVSGRDVNVGSFGFGTNVGATTQVRLSNDGHIVVSDIASHGQDDRLTVRAEGFESSPDQQTPQVRVHDPNHILTTTIGVQEGLHTVFIPITVAISSNLIEINGRDGNDILTVALGAFLGVALVNGGNGNDTIAISGGVRFVRSSADDHGDLASQIKNHDHTGEDRHSAMLDDVGQFTTSTLNGGSGSDRIVASNSLPGVILNGDSGNDSIVGGAGDDSLQGGLGDDTLAGGDGADELSGGDGADQLRGDNGMDRLQGNAGNDLLEGGADDDLFRLIDGDDRDVISGGQGFDTITVEGTSIAETYRVGITSSQVRLQRTNSTATRLTVDVRDGESLVVHGLAGNDRLELGTIAAQNTAVSFDGGLGDDTLQLNGTSNRDRWRLADFDHPLINRPRSAAVANVSAATEHVLVNLGGGNDVFSAEGVFAPEVQITVRGESGNDTITGSAGRDSLLGGDGDDLITGGAGNDRVFGENGNDTLFGGEGNDLLLGNDGDDQLDGQAGTDRLVGGSGRNTFISPADGEIVAAFNVNLQRLLDQV